MLFLTLCVQLQTAMCVTRCAQTQAAGVRGLISVSPAGTTAEMVHVWAAVIFTQGEEINVYMDMFAVVLLPLCWIHLFYLTTDILIIVSSELLGNLQGLMASVWPVTRSVSLRVGEAAVLGW